jgi:hypothetical protein
MLIRTIVGDGEPVSHERPPRCGRAAAIIEPSGKRRNTGRLAWHLVTAGDPCRGKYVLRLPRGASHERVKRLFNPVALSPILPASMRAFLCARRDPAPHQSTATTSMGI